LAAELGISKTTVQRVLAQSKLRPHRLDRYMASNDPEFEGKAAGIIGLHMNPSQHAAVFCIDEKTDLTGIFCTSRIERLENRKEPPENAKKDVHG
jgi:hypothetical protein